MTIGIMHPKEESYSQKSSSSISK